MSLYILIALHIFLGYLFVQKDMTLAMESRGQGQGQDQAIISSQGHVDNCGVNHSKNHQRLFRHSRASKDRANIISNPFDPSYNCAGEFSINRIVGGEKAVPFSMPWMVYLKGKIRRPGYFLICSGTLITRQWVLTAGHCMFDKRKNQIRYLYAIAGVNDITKCDRDVGFSFQKVNNHEKYMFLHPFYDSLMGFQDIALVKLPKPVPDLPHMKPLCLPIGGQNPQIGDICVAAGWGVTHPLRPYVSKELYQIDVRVVKCDYPTHDAICTARPAHVKKAQDSCNGDSGGPLVCSIDGVQMVVGVLSQGPKECNGNIETPARYTRVTSYAEWVKGVITKN